MTKQPEGPAEEIKRLQRCINDLVAILTLPAIWAGGQASQIVGTLNDSLLGMLRLDLVFVRLTDPSGEVPWPMARFAPTWEPTPQPQEIGEVIDQWLGSDSQEWPGAIRKSFRGREITLVPLRLGLQGEFGLIAAGSQRVDFPQQTERLVLSVAANEAAIGLQESSLRSLQRRAASELDQLVAQRTAELAATNEELKKEIAERKSTEDALNKARSELAHVARVTALSALTASIAHEVNQPLSGIVTNASTCLRMLDANPPNLEGARETARRTIRDGNRASEVIARLRALFSKKNATFEAFDLNEAAREVIALSLNELQRDRVILQREFAADLPSVVGDRIQIQQVILNLMRNGSDAMSTINDRPRELLIRTERDQSGGVRLSVKDAGVGIDPQIEERLFEAFHTTKSDGMGIGLSVSQSIVDSHQGRLWAMPNEGPGATFIFSIPCSTNTLV